MRDVRWGIIGFGQAGSTFARHINTHTRTALSVTDPLLILQPPAEHISERIAGLSIDVVTEVGGLVRRCDLTLSLVTPAVAAEVAEEAGAANAGGLYLDCNSVSPSEKQRMAQFFTAGSYVDVTVLGNVAGHSVGAPLAISGPRADEACAHLQAAGFTVWVAGHDVGSASAVKMCRSIFMKGIECLLLETLLAASEFRVSDAVLHSIEETISSLGLQATVEMLVTTHAVHCGRRSDEMRHVTAMLEEMGLPHDMSRAAVDVLSRSRDRGLVEHVQGRVPDRAQDVIAYLAPLHRGESSP
jgi:3-hydroxyisobutyrate dehydrogenase-like beta-hydroxyacid dehydrogenase